MRKLYKYILNLFKKKPIYSGDWIDINRVQKLNDELITCSNIRDGIDVLKVERNNQTFSILRKLN